MKRGFLNTEKAKRAIDKAHDNTYTKKEANPSRVNTLDVYPPRLDLHSVPQSVKDAMDYPADKNRFVFRVWPRDPKGKPILPSEIHGKEAGNGLNLWGATLYDFYRVHRIPHITHAITISTGSKLKKVMEAFGELEHAKDELTWAEREEDPKETLAWDPAQAIEVYERQIFSNIQRGAETGNEEGPSVPASASLDKHERPAHRDVSAPEPNSLHVASDVAIASDSIENHATAVNSDPLAQIPGAISSPFHRLHYPPPWSFAPFEAPYTPFALRRGIPIHSLPKKIYVHDPWKLVEVVTESEDDENDEDVANQVTETESWTSKDDNILVYTLSLPSEPRKAAQEAVKAAAIAEDEALKREQSVLILPQNFEGPTEQPAIRAILPQRPRKLTEVPEAHLYLSPKGKLGLGNHSVVHVAEWELPRDLFCESTICDECLNEQVKLEVERLKDSGEWERRLEEATKNYKGNPQGEQSPGLVAADGKDTSTDPATPINGSLQRKTVGLVKLKVESQPMETIDMLGFKANEPGETPGEKAPSQFFVLSDEVINRSLEYEGPVITVRPDIIWQNPSLSSTICKHQAENKKPVPRTAVFRVAAKLSIPGDAHLDREARNYLKFPAHFFQHWNGYNVVPPLHDPVPVGALVPQFFGYYTCDSQPDGQYRSPILLIEHCGQPIDVKQLSIDDRHECAALLFRFHYAGWIHESFAERNILMLEGQPTRNPLEKHKEDRPYSFRLIDFGRSEEYTDSSMRALEECKGKQLFGLI